MLHPVRESVQIYVNASNVAYFLLDSQRVWQVTAIRESSWRATELESSMRKRQHYLLSEKQRYEVLHNSVHCSCIIRVPPSAAFHKARAPAWQASSIHAKRSIVSISCKEDCTPHKLASLLTSIVYQFRWVPCSLAIPPMIVHHSSNSKTSLLCLICGPIARSLVRWLVSTSSLWLAVLGTGNVTWVLYNRAVIRHASYRLHISCDAVRSYKICSCKSSVVGSDSNRC